VADATGLDIHADKYTSTGTSKAKKLREFWRLEDDATVAELLEAFIDHEEERDADAELVAACKEIVSRLRSGGSHVQALKQQASTFDAPHLARSIARLEKSIDSDPELAIGSAKELVETCCKTILSKRGVEIPASDDLQKLAKATFTCLDLLPDGVDKQRRGEDAIKQVLRSFSSTVQGLAELRNLYGTGHGKHGKSASVQARHARLAVGAAATLATFLFETHSYKSEATATPPSSGK
jgi:23S rRNA pseudoU1915 N3-methylase RlmH